MRVFTLFIFVLLAVAGYSQNTINNYKYVIVPEKFDFLREVNQYGLNTTTKLLLEQKGFEVFWDDKDLPMSLATNKCNALRAEVVQRKGLFVTNITVFLKDCQGNVIFKSKEGKSREKEFPIAYDGALRDAFVSLNDVPYKYDGTVFTQTQQATPVTPATTQPTTQPAAPAPTSTPATTPTAPADTKITGTLYAQAIPNGFQLIDTSPKKVLTLLKTSVADYFIADGGADNGIVFKKDGEWLLEYYKENKLVSQKLDIKF